MSELLKVTDLSISFGGLVAVDNFNLTLDQGELYGLIGPNGAGKTTIFNLLTGVYKPTRGEILFNGESLLPHSIHKISNFGIKRTFQNIRLFKELSVLENVLLGLFHDTDYGILSTVFRTPAFFKEEKRLLERAHEVLDFMGLTDNLTHEAGSLPYGKQRRLEIARALASHPKLLFLDEPAAGMNATETEALMQLIALIRKKYHLAILLIEHDMKFVMGICEKIKVIDHGVTIAFGNPLQIKNSPAVIEAYLGSEEVRK